LKKLGKPIWFTLAPMVLVFSVTVVSLVLQIKALTEAAIGSASWLNGLVSLVLLGLALILVAYAYRAWQATTAQPAQRVKAS